MKKNLLLLSSLFVLASLPNSNLTIAFAESDVEYFKDTEFTHDVSNDDE